MDLSIVVPFRQTPVPLLRRLLSSIPKAVEGINKWETIIVDDGSSRPLEMDWIKGILAPPERLSIRRLSEHSGIGSARNEGFLLSKGRFVTFVDSDDVLLESGLARLLEFAADNRVVFADHLVYQPDASNYLIRRKAHWLPILNSNKGTQNSPFLYCNFIVLPALISRSRVYTIGGYPNTGYAGEHVAFYASLARSVNVEFFHIPEFLYEYRPTEESNSIIDPVQHDRAKGSVLISEAHKFGFTDWEFSGVSIKREADATLYLPYVSGQLYIPPWADINLEAGYWNPKRSQL